MDLDNESCDHDELANCRKLLEAKSMELQQFVYIVSHDLQAPLQNLQLFVELLESGNTTQLDEESRSFLKYIKESSSQISNQIQVLLNYSRLGKSKIKQELDVFRLVQEVEKELSGAVAKVQGHIIFADLPQVYGFYNEIKILFKELIDNALKFKKESKSPIVRVACEESDSHWIFSVEDNGIGIESGAFERIFLIFQRLNPKNAYEGQGAGLAYAKKVVELHGGNIWVASKLNQGTTVFFTLTKK